MYVYDLFEMVNAPRDKMIIYTDTKDCKDYKFHFSTNYRNLESGMDNTEMAKLVMCCGVDTSFVIDSYRNLSVTIDNLGGQMWYLVIHGLKPVSKCREGAAIDFEGGNLVSISEFTAVALLSDIKFKQKLYTYIYVSINGVVMRLDKALYGGFVW